jgi:ATP-dependent helicase/nuclease subunit B
MLALVLGQLGQADLDRERPADAVDLNGWLELPWEDAPHLIVAGLNDGFVPDATVGHPYLPESLRQHLGLRRSNATRLARDAYLLRHLLASREKTGGRVDVVLGKFSAVGDPLRPSRLLFMVPDEELPVRAAALFGDDRLPKPQALPPHRLAWRLQAPAPGGRKAVTSLWVTAFRDYLACPFRFYLRHILGLEELDPDPRELDALAFGNLCHAALKALHEDPAVRHSDDERRIAGFLRNELRRAVERDYGRRLTVPLRVQLASAQRRLAAFAVWQAASVRDGWETVQTEVTFDALLGRSWILAGLEVRGRIDRVDARGADRRIIDYKTSDAPMPVPEAHCGKRLTAVTAARIRHDWQKVRIGSDNLAWCDLQLPLYALAAREAFGTIPDIGYFHLARAADDCRYESWTGLDAAVLESAQRCAEGVIEAVRAQIFWPPNGAVQYDEFARLFGGTDAETAVDPTALLAPAPV